MPCSWARYTLTPLAAIQHKSELPEGRRKAALRPANTDPTLFSAMEHQAVSDMRTPGWGQKMGLAEVAILGWQESMGREGCWFHRSAFFFSDGIESHTLQDGLKLSLWLRMTLNF